MERRSADFATFYENARDDCLRAVTATVGSRQAAEELVAEAFARAWASWAKIADHPAPQAWVVRTALNFHISWWRRRRRDMPVPNWSEPASVDADPNSVVPDRRLMAALKALPTRQRQVIALRIFLDLDNETTARTLGIAPGTVTAHLARATRSLRASFVPATEQE